MTPEGPQSQESASIAEMPRDERGTSRLEAFSDGVIAVAITLLVLNIQVPEPKVGQTLGDALLGQGTTYLGYVASFLIIGIYWANHHGMFRWVARADHLFLLINTVFLMCLVLVPFATSLITKYMSSPHIDAKRTAGVVYSGILLLVALMFNLVWWYASSRGRLLHDNLDLRLVGNITRRYLVGPVNSIIAVLIALYSVEASLVFYILGAIYFSLPLDRLFEYLAERRKAPLP